MNLGQLRSYIRDHLEVDEEELPDTLLNRYLQDAFDRTLSVDNRWPREQVTWELSKVVGAMNVSMPTTMLIPAIVSVMTTDGRRLVYMTHENAEDMFQNYLVTTGQPVYWSTWGRKIWLWPNPGVDVSYDIVVRGHTRSAWNNNATAIPDIDTRLHPALAYYAMALAYAAQEDEILEGVYMARWDRDVQAFARVILEPPRHRPLVLHGGAPVLGTASYVIVPPET